MKDLKQSYFEQGNFVTDKMYEDTVIDILNLCKFKNQKEISVLDVGSGFGKYSFALANKVKEVVGVEPFKQAFEISVKDNTYPNVKFYYGLIEDFDSQQKFDLILSLTTIEHMPDAEKSFKKMFNLLKPGGFMYITAPNKLWPIECHYGLPFLSYLPLNVANQYLRICKKGDSYEDSSYSKTYQEMKKFLKQFNCEFRFVTPDPNSSYLGCGNQNLFSKKFKKFGINLIRKYPFLWTFSKGFIILAKKPL